jgi:nucleotide-binding universal stress UspA family protein
MTTILAATDGSEGAGRAVVAAAEAAKALGAHLEIVTVQAAEPDNDLKIFSRAEGAPFGDIMEAAAQEVLEGARRIATEAGLKAVKLRSVVGDPAEAILDVIERSKAGMVVVGRRGRGQLRGLLLGSVSQKLVTLAPCRVMVVP